MKSKRLKYCCMLAGILLIACSIFHESLWFDEAYSVSLARQSFVDIWRIDTHDVHPPLYYMMLHFIGLFTNQSILSYRIFSWICIIILVVTARKLITKEWGEKVSDLYTILVLFTPMISVYTGEIRMYTLVMLLVTISCIVACRILKRNDQKDWILFALINIITAYTHYYGLLAIALCNLYLLVYFLRHNQKALLRWTFFGILQIVCYLPWLMILFAQTGSVQNSFWLAFVFPQSIIEMLTFQFAGNLTGSAYLPDVVVLCIEIVLLVLYFVRQPKKQLDAHFSIFTIGVYGGVILIAIAVSLLLRRDIFYARYLLCCSGVLLLFFAQLLAQCDQNRRRMIIGIHVICTLFVNVRLCMMTYDPSNEQPYTYLTENLQEGDVILVSNHEHDPNSFIALSKIQTCPVIYWNAMEWSKESILAYEGFHPSMRVIDNLSELNDYEGRICVIYGDDDHHQKPYTDVSTPVLKATHGKLADQKFFTTTYKNIEYTITFIDCK